MFDISFGELMLIAVVGLIVLGPERLPHAIRTVMRFVTKVKTVVGQARDELEHELKVQELQENLLKAEKMNMEDLSPELKESVDALKQAAQEVQRPYATKGQDTQAPSPEARVSQSTKTDDSSELDAGIAFKVPRVDDTLGQPTAESTTKDSTK